MLSRAPNPWRIFLKVLLTVFLVEVAVMLVLPILVTDRFDRRDVALVDACLLTFAAAPILWWVVIRPLRRKVVTEQAKAESIVTAAVEGIITIDQRGVVDSFNPAAEQMFGYRAEEVVGRNLTMLMPADSAARHQDGLLQYPTAPESNVVGQTLEVTGVRKDGCQIPLLLSVSQFEVEGHRFFTGVLRDLTETRYQAGQMATVAQLATGVAHEIRNPLTSIKMLIQTGKRSTAHGLEAGDLDVIESEIRRMERSLTAFLDFARPAEPEHKRLRLVPLVERTFALVKSRALRQEVQLKCVAPEAPFEVWADEDQLQQLLLNLVLNGLDAMPKGGELRIEMARISHRRPDQGRKVLPEQRKRRHPTSHSVGVENRETATVVPAEAAFARSGLPGDEKCGLDPPSQDEFELRVMDTGPGIPRELMNRLFQPFVSSKDTGVGLGLVICRRIAEDHGGVLAVGNQRDGGACFTLRMPLAAHDSAKQE